MEATRRTRVVDRQRDIASTSGTSVLGKTAAPVSPGDRPTWRQMMSLPTSPDIGTPPGWPCRLTRRMTPAVPRRQGRRSYAALRRRDAVLARERVLLSGNQVAPSGPLAPRGHVIFNGPVIRDPPAASGTARSHRGPCDNGPEIAWRACATALALCGRDHWHIGADIDEHASHVDLPFPHSGTTRDY